MEGLERLRGVARRLVWFGLGLSLLPLLAWLSSSLLTEMAPGLEGGLAARLAALLVLVLMPVGLVLLALGAAATVWAWWLGGRDG